MFLVGNQMEYIILNLSINLHSLNRTGYKIGTKFNKDPLPVEQNNYLTKIINVYIVYDLAAW